MKNSFLSFFVLLLLTSSCKNSAEDYFKQGNDSLTVGADKASIKLYDKAIALKSDYAWAYGNRGFAKIKIMDYKGALQDLEKANKLDPKTKEVYYSLGLVKAYLKDYTGAIKMYTAGISLDPKLAACYYGRAGVKEETKNYIEALADYNQAILLAPEGRTYHNRGLLKMILNDKDGACADFHKALELGIKWAKDDIEKNCK
jgi:tetratricopeptide (TPR) repeat protein